MYGVLAQGRVSCQRLVTDYGFEGHPLRKDFPVVGYNELYYDSSRGYLSYEAVTFAQVGRVWLFTDP